MSLYSFLVAVRSDGQQLMSDTGETTSHLMGLFYRTLRIVDNGIKPLYVFDGAPPKLKSGELAKRFQRKSEAQDNGTAAPMNGKASMPRDASSSPKVNGRQSEEASRPADEAQKSPVPDVDEGAEKDEQQQKQAEEAQLLRERALEALSAAAAKQPAAEGDGASDDLSRKPGEHLACHDSPDCLQRMFESWQ